MNFCHHCGFKLTEQTEACPSCNKTFDIEGFTKNKVVNDDTLMERLKPNQQNINFIKKFIINNKYFLFILLVALIILTISSTKFLIITMTLYVIGIYVYSILMNTSESTKIEEFLKNAIKDIKDSSKEQTSEKSSYKEQKQIHYTSNRKKADGINIFIFVMSFLFGIIGAFALTSGEIVSEALGVMVIVCVIALVIYFIPTLSSNGSSKPAIFLTNIFFGWTFLGWLICLIWAVNNNGSTRLNQMMVEKIDLDARNRDSIERQLKEQEIRYKNLSND